MSTLALKMSTVPPESWYLLTLRYNFLRSDADRRPAGLMTSGFFGFGLGVDVREVSLRKHLEQYHLPPCLWVPLK